MQPKKKLYKSLVQLYVSYCDDGIPICCSCHYVILVVEGTVVVVEVPCPTIAIQRVVLR